MLSKTLTISSPYSALYLSFSIFRFLEDFIIFFISSLLVLTTFDCLLLLIVSLQLSLLLSIGYKQNILFSLCFLRYFQLTTCLFRESIRLRVRWVLLNLWFFTLNIDDIDLTKLFFVFSTLFSKGLIIFLISFIQCLFTRQRKLLDEFIAFFA